MPSFNFFLSCPWHGDNDGSDDGGDFGQEYNPSHLLLAWPSRDHNLGNRGANRAFRADSPKRISPGWWAS